MYKYVIIAILGLLILLAIKPVYKFFAQDKCLDSGSVWEYSFDRCYSDNNEVFEFASNSEMYIQDGHNLHLVNIEKLSTCNTCSKYNFYFDHYGDPEVSYKISVLVKNKILSFE